APSASGTRLVSDRQACPPWWARLRRLATSATTWKGSAWGLGRCSLVAPWWPSSAGRPASSRRESPTSSGTGATKNSTAGSGSLPLVAFGSHVMGHLPDGDGAHIPIDAGPIIADVGVPGLLELLQQQCVLPRRRHAHRLHRGKAVLLNEL